MGRGELKEQLTIQRQVDILLPVPIYLFLPLSTY